MKTTIQFIALVLILALSSCQKGTSENSSAYFEKTNDSIQNGGVKVIPITTSKGILRFGPSASETILK